MNLKKVALALALTAGSASAESTFDSLGYVAGIFGLLSLMLSYRLIYFSNGLDAQIIKKTAQLKRLQEETKKYETEIKKQREDGARSIDGRVESELAKAKDAASDRHRFEGLDKNYWQRIGQMDPATADSPHLKKLMDEKAEVERMISLTKLKYLEMDKKSFDNIMEGYQRRLIELEAKISGIRGDRGGN